MAASGTWGLIARVARSPELRRVQLAYAGYSVSEYATWLAMLFYALERGGAREAGVVAFVQLIPSVVLTPFSSYAGDRFPPRRALAVGYGVQSLTMAATAAAMWADHSVAVYVVGAVVATAISFTRPVMRGSLLPQLTHSPTDLVAANVVLGLIGRFGAFVGPLTAGVLLALSSPGMVFAAAAVATGIACLAVLVTHLDDDPSTYLPDSAAALHRVLAGFGAVRRVPRVRVLIGILAVAGLVNGVCDVAAVAVAGDRLGGGGGQSGALAAAYGVGGMFGALAVTTMLRRREIARPLLVSASLIAVGLAGMSFVGALAPALLAFAFVGLGENALRLASIVTIQAEAPSDVLCRVFGIVEGAQMASIAVGSLAVTVLLSWLTFGQSMIVLAVVAPALVGVGIMRIARHGGAPPPVDDAIVDRLLQDRVFAPLPAPKIERLARNASVRSLAAGTAVITQGAHGDKYYLVVSGALDVSIDGRLVATVSECDSFGELALLRDAPRAATVTATSPVTLLVVDRDDFLEIVTGHPRSLSAAGAVVDSFTS